MSVTGIDHLYLETRDLDRSLKFYRALGFSVEAEWGEGDHRAVKLVSGSAAVVLALTSPQTSPQGATVHFALENAEEMDRALAALPEADVVIPLADTHWGTRWIRVRDPDGNFYCLEASR